MTPSPRTTGDAGRPGGLRTGLDQISSAVLDAEAEHGLLSLRAEGAPLWQRIRFEVHRRLLVETGAMGPPEPVASEVRSRFMARARTLRASVRRSAFFGPPRCEVLFAGSGRRVLDAEWGWYAPCCGPVAHACGLRPLVAEYYLGRWGPAAPGVPTRYLDRLHLTSLPGRAVGRPPAMAPDVVATLQQAARTLHLRTGVSLDLDSITRRDLAARRHDLPCYRGLLERCGARLVVVECGYDKHSLLEAARGMQVPVVELQHGVLSRHHFGYHFPRGDGRPPLAPDWFFAWGEYWRTAADLPLPAERVLAIGFPRFDRDRAEARTSHDRLRAPARGSGTVLFLSQAMLGDTLSRFAADLAEQGLRERIVFRLHPREEDGWQVRYPWLRKAGVRVCGSETPLYPQLAGAPVHVGTFSTALFEGLALGARLYLVPAPGIEYMDELVRAGRATVTCTPGALAERLRSEPGSRPGSSGDDLFRPGALSRAAEAIRAVAEGRAPAAAAAG